MQRPPLLPWCRAYAPTLSRERNGRGFTNERSPSPWTKRGYGTLLVLSLAKLSQSGPESTIPRPRCPGCHWGNNPNWRCKGRQELNRSTPEPRLPEERCRAFSFLLRVIARAKRADWDHKATGMPESRGGKLRIFRRNQRWRVPVCPVIFSDYRSEVAFHGGVFVSALWTYAADLAMFYVSSSWRSLDPGTLRSNGRRIALNQRQERLRGGKSDGGHYW